MLDPVACAGMEIGEPRVAVTALIDLHHLLIERGFRRIFRDDSHIILEERDDKIATAGPAAGAAPAEHRVRLHPTAGMAAAERAKVLAVLANLLMQAAGAAARECSDDKR